MLFLSIGQDSQEQQDQESTLRGAEAEVSERLAKAPGQEKRKQIMKELEGKVVEILDQGGQLLGNQLACR